MKPFLSILFLLVLAWAGNAQPATGSLLIKNGTVLTVTKGTFENTDVLVVDGKIKQIGKNIRTPQGVTEIDATGKFVMPGILDAHSHIALDVVNEATRPVTSDVWVGDALDPLDISIYRALAGGVTTIHAMHGSANAIGGECETIKLRYGTYDPEDLRMQGAPRTIKFALGENPMRSHGEGNGIVPRTRMGVEQVIRRAFSEAQEYMAAKDKYNAVKATDPTALPPTFNRRMETLAEILKGNIIIHCHSYRADEILMLMNVCRDYGVKRLCFQHTNEGFKVAPELAAFGAGASVFADWWAYKFEVYYSTAYNAAIMTKNGVVTSINSDSEELIRHLYHEAAKTQRYGGLTDDEALALITINSAKQLGIDQRVGSLEVGKDGDVAIFNAHPLSVYAIPMMTIVDGIVRFDRAKDADDQRMQVDPEKAETAFFLAQEHKNADHCLEDAFDFANELFGFERE
ncbi:MAG: amidohydrolase family protein [Lewinellaceae bacterium]|nr:amidohydrolase family protein [Lewinellaceae bacterium]